MRLLYLLPSRGPHTSKDGRDSRSSESGYKVQGCFNWKRVRRRAVPTTVDCLWWWWWWWGFCLFSKRSAIMRTFKEAATSLERNMVSRGSPVSSDCLSQSDQCLRWTAWTPQKIDSWWTFSQSRRDGEIELLMHCG